MEKSQKDYVRDFHLAFSIAISEKPTQAILKLRRNLIEEEVKELFTDIDKAISHLGKNEPVPTDLWANMLKELADVQISLSGTWLSLKPLERFEEAFKRVCESEMSKLGADGKPIFREDGKVLKGPNYFKPDLSDLVS